MASHSVGFLLMYITGFLLIIIIQSSCIEMDSSVYYIHPEIIMIIICKCHLPCGPEKKYKMCKEDISV